MKNVGLALHIVVTNDVLEHTAQQSVFDFVSQDRRSQEIQVVEFTSDRAQQKIAAVVEVQLYAVDLSWPRQIRIDAIFVFDTFGVGEVLQNQIDSMLLPRVQNVHFVCYHPT